MGRISKRKSAASEDKSIQKGKIYQAGIYARLSSDRDTKKNESVEVQIEIARKFVAEWNQKRDGETIDVVECYTDLGKTGSNFERDGFTKLMQDIRLGDINCVIVKDLSRFARNYLEAGNYIEKIFPFLGVRFIAVADGYDTGEKGNDTRQMASEIKNLVNDMYAKDFSKKAKLHLKQRRQEGSYVGGPPPYGYRAVWEGKIRKLVPDENTSMIVIYLYEQFMQTESYTKTADELNRQKINPPGVYRSTGEVYFNGADELYKGWDKGSVERILKSETYTGTLAQGKTSITARSEKNRKQIPEEDWIVRENAHEALVSLDIFQKVKKIQEKIRQETKSHQHPTSGYPISENVFDQVLYCGVCGRKMTRSSAVKTYENGEKTRLDGYFCLNGGQTKVTICPKSNRISKRELTDILLPLLRMEFALYLERPKHFLEYGKKRIAETRQRLGIQLQETEYRIRRSMEEESQSYMEYRMGKIEQKKYVACKLQQERHGLDLQKQKDEQETRKKNLEKISEKYIAAIRSLIRLKTGNELTKEIIEALIERIYVYPGKRIEVIFAFTAEHMEGVTE